MRRVSVLVAEDHTVVREGLVALLKKEPDIDVVAEAADGEEALERIEAGRPDVAVVDVAMPRMTGIELARKVRDAGLRTAVVLLSMHEEPVFVKAGIEAGASGYVLKTAKARELVDAVRAAAAGDMYLSPRITHAVVERKRARAGGGGGPDAGPPDVAALAPRERDVLRLLARGLSSKEIAAELGIAARTVDAYRADIMAKLGIHSVPGLVKHAIRSGLATLDEP